MKKNQGVIFSLFFTVCDFFNLMMILALKDVIPKLTSKWCNPECRKEEDVILGQFCCCFDQKIWSKLFSAAVLYSCFQLVLFSARKKDKVNHNFSVFGSRRREQYILATTHAPPRFQFRHHTSWKSETEDDCKSKLCFMFNCWRMKDALLA